VSVALEPFGRLVAADKREVVEEAERLESFLEGPVELSM
jgi:hypothetical protein